ncbi:MAG: DUF4252 domain-containing protein [Bacteroidales bacterium]|jgi:hypothetical protein|nr:DUF4252 domain-containing protein [Bacteroidales bacterium]
MKKITTIFLGLFVFTLVINASSPLKSIFKKYKSSKDCKIITFNSDFLNISSGGENNDEFKELEELKEKFELLRIFTLEGDHDLKSDIKKAKINKYYKEMMRVHESDQDVVIMVREEGKIIKEFVVLVYGDENVIIQIKGQLNRNDISSIGEAFNMKEMIHIKKLEELEKE